MVPLLATIHPTQLDRASDDLLDVSGRAVVIVLPAGVKMQKSLVSAGLRYENRWTSLQGPGVHQNHANFPEDESQRLRKHRWTESDLHLISFTPVAQLHPLCSQNVSHVSLKKPCHVIGKLM